MEGKYTLGLVLAVLLLILAIRTFWKGDGDHPPMGDVSGTITMDGKPLAGVMVAFFPEKGRPATAVADDQGHYVLRYTSDVSGSKVGPSTVHLTWETGVSGPPIPERYGLNKSELTADVKPGDNVFDFSINSDPPDQNASKTPQTTSGQIAD